MSQDSQAAAAPVPATASLGGALRELRIAKGLSLEDVSARLKYSSRQIQALEEERWDSLPSGLSLRGMIRNYARLVGADTDLMVQALPGQDAAPERSAGRDLGASAAIGGDSAPRGGSSAPWGWLLAILIVVAAVVAYAFWQGWLPKELLTLDGIKQHFHR